MKLNQLMENDSKQELTEEIKRIYGDEAYDVGYVDSDEDGISFEVAPHFSCDIIKRDDKYLLVSVEDWEDEEWVKQHQDDWKKYVLKPALKSGYDLSHNNEQVKHGHVFATKQADQSQNVDAVLNQLADQMTQDLYGVAKNLVKGAGIDDNDGENRNKLLSIVYQRLANNDYK